MSDSFRPIDQDTRIFDLFPPDTDTPYQMAYREDVGQVIYDLLSELLRSLTIRQLGQFKAALSDDQKNELVDGLRAVATFVGNSFSEAQKAALFDVLNPVQRAIMLDLEQATIAKLREVLGGEVVS